MDLKQQWFETDKLRFLILKDRDFEKVALVNEADAVIIVYTSHVLTQYVLDKIRTDDRKEIYLTPVFIYNSNQNQQNIPVYSHLTDGYINTADMDFSEFREKVDSIKGKIARLETVKGMNFDSYIINKMLRYCYTRDIHSFEPITDRKTKLGYSYPLISRHFSPTDEYNVLDILKTAEDEGYIIGEYKDSIYLCNNCYNGFLFYREVCPKCDSSNLKQEDLIHHFPCAYIGPMTDFTNELDKSELSCPKCDKELKHIGVDYDKPSAIYTCNTCAHTFQSVQINAKCCECHKDMPVEHLLHRTIKKYLVTNKGFYTALDGISTTQKDLSLIPGTVSMDIFKTMLQYEIERMKIAKIESNLGYIHINNGVDLYIKVGKDMKLNLLGELAQIIRNEVRSSDVIAFQNTSTLFFSLTESKTEEAELKVKRISILIRKLIRDNFNGFQSDISYSVHPIDKTLSYVEQLKKLTTLPSKKNVNVV